MIGDWVRGTADLDTEWYGWQIAPGECIQVRSILHTGINYESNGVAPSFEDDTIRFDDIEPIPLSPDILERNGLGMIAAAIFCDVHYPKGSTRYFFSYVHELQHALRLCGIDKELTL